MKVKKSEVSELLLEYTELYNKSDFITSDPISIPHSLSRYEDQEIMGLFAAILAWGNRQTTIKSCQKLIQHMDNSPVEFLRYGTTKDRSPLHSFVHRTFNGDDLLCLLDFLSKHYQKEESLITAFMPSQEVEGSEMKKRLASFHNRVFSDRDYPSRTKKHIATPTRGSACKRLNLYLKWMVRKDEGGVDLGIWRRAISSKELVCPIDVHVHNTALKLGLIESSQKVNWKTAEALTARLRGILPEDPVKLDFGLFGLSHSKLINRIELIN